MANTTTVMALAALAFCTWGVFLGGLASLQADCATGTGTASGTAALNGVRGFSSFLLPCMKVYRYYWFIMAFEIVIVAALAMVLATKKFAQSRLAFLGLFAIAALLYIQTTDSFLTAESSDGYSGGQARHRMRTATAGALMTAVANVFLVVALGISEAVAVPAVEIKQATAV